MLNFSRPTAPASPNDLVWAFHGRNLVSELMGSQGAPIPLASLQADFDPPQAPENFEKRGLRLAQILYYLKSASGLGCGANDFGK